MLLFSGTIRTYKMTESLTPNCARQLLIKAVVLGILQIISPTSGIRIHSILGAGESVYKCKISFGVRNFRTKNIVLR